MSTEHPDFPGTGDIWYHSDPRDACLGLQLILSHLDGSLVDDGGPQYVKKISTWVRGRSNSSNELVAYEGAVKIARVSPDTPVEKVRAALDYLLGEMDGRPDTLRRG